MQKTLVAFDADRIKSYVFGTDKLKEIRGASARLDKLNREIMRTEAQKIGEGKIHPIYTNGGQGLFVVIADDAETIATTFGKRVQMNFTEMTHGGASVTYVIQPLLASLPDDIDELKKADLSSYLRLVQVKMDLKKGCPTTIVTLPSHPLMRQCDACGIRYAEEHIIDNNEVNDLFHCSSCRGKQEEDNAIKKNLENIFNGNTTLDEQNILNEGLWERISFYLKEATYDFPPLEERSTPQRPNDFHAFRPFAESKEYIGLIYADANNMGAKVNQLTQLGIYEKFAEGVDRAIHRAMSSAIKKHLPLVQATADEGTRMILPLGKRMGSRKRSSRSIFFWWGVMIL